MSAYLSCVDWATLYHTNPCADALWNAFCHMLHTTINLFVPSPSQYTNTPCLTKPRIPKSIRRCDIKKRNLWKKLRCSPNDIVLQIKYHECTLEWRRLLHCKQISAEENIIRANNLGAFYRFRNKRIANRHIINDSGQVLADSFAKTNALNAYFSSVGTVDNGNTPECQCFVLQSVLDSIVIDASDVM